tara:strand:- start:57 stop:2264 length:2208 start_codon:yes stop_codon:yes gene_type:complete
MDKTLMRPLFRKRATQLRVVDSKAVPKFFVGGIMSAANTARAVAAPVFRYLGNKMSGPKVSTALTGLEAGSAGYGINEMAKGVRDGDTGQFLEGAAYAVPGAAFLPSTARRSGIAAIRELGEFGASKTTPVAQALINNPGKTAVGSIGTALIGQGMQGDGTASDLSQVSEGVKSIEDRLIYSKPEYNPDPKKKVTQNLKDYKEMEKNFKPKVIGVENPSTPEEIQLNEDLPKANKIIAIAEELGLDVNNLASVGEETLKKIAEQTDVPLPDVLRLSGFGGNGQDPEPVAPTIDGQINQVTQNIEGMTDDEVNRMVKNRQNEIKKANNLSPLSKEFQTFKNELDQMTGGSGNLNNLIAMKFAAKLMTGKSNQRGLSGLVDIAGQGLESASTDLMNIALAQKNQDMVLAQSFLKSKAAAAKAAKAGPGFVGGDKVFSVEDPAYPGQFYNVKGMMGKDGKIYHRNKNNEVVEATAGAYERPINSDKMNLYASNLEENKRGAEMIDFVINSLPQDGTFSAAFGLAKEDIFGTLEQVTGSNGITSSDFDSEIKSLMRNNDGTEEGMKATEKMLKEYDKDMSKVEKRANEMAKASYKERGGGFLSRPSDDELARFTKLALIEQRMKYLVANANKAEDRLTQKDIENAAQRTEIIKFYGSAKTVRANYMNLKKEFEDKAQSFAMSYRQNGGTESSMQYFKENVPGVEQLYSKQQADFLSNQRTKNKTERNKILTTIPIAGVN